VKTSAEKAILLLILFVAPACAALAGEGDPAPSPDPFASLIRLAGSMAIVIGVILGAALLTKKLFARARSALGPDRTLRLHQTESLGAKRQIYVLDVGETMLVVGAAGDSMRLLAKLPKPACETADAPPADASFEKTLAPGAPDNFATGEAAR